MRTTSKVLLRTDKYVAVKSMGKLYILRFIGVTEPKQALLEEAQKILKLGSGCYFDCNVGKKNEKGDLK